MATTIKVPRTVAGMKVPKAMRRGINKGLRKSGALQAVLDSPIGRAVLAEALVAAAAAAAAALNRHRPSGAQIAQAGGAALEAGAEAAGSAKSVAAGAADALVGVVGEAARSVLGRGERDDADERRYVPLSETDRKKGKERDKPSKH